MKNAGIEFENKGIKRNTDFYGFLPLGAIIPVIPGYYGDGANGSYTNVLLATNDIAGANTYYNPVGLHVCDGAALNDAESTIFNGGSRYLPNITDDRFIMGDNAVGGSGGSNVLTDHTHTDTLAASAGAHNHTANTGAAGVSLGSTGKTSTGPTGTHTHTFTSGNQSANHSHGGTIGDESSHTHSITHTREPAAGGIRGYMMNTGDVALYQASATASGSAHNHSLSLDNNNADHNHSGTTAVGSGTHTHSTDISHDHSTHIHTIVNGTAPVITVSGSVGAGSAPSITENRPQYISAIYLMRVK